MQIACFGKESTCFIHMTLRMCTPDDCKMADVVYAVGINLLDRG